MRRRLFTGVADLAIEPGFRRPKDRWYPKPFEGGGVILRLYVFARGPQEASEKFHAALASARYNVRGLSNVAPNGSHLPWPLDERFLSSKEFVRARKTGAVVLGRMVDYEDDE